VIFILIIAVYILIGSVVCSKMIREIAWERVEKYNRRYYASSRHHHEIPTRADYFYSIIFAGATVVVWPVYAIMNHMMNADKEMVKRKKELEELEHELEEFSAASTSVER
jgi:uncharacterized membrane protein YjgN (DUF898 family)